MKAKLLITIAGILYLTGCTVEDKFELPVIVTQEILQITDSSAISGGLITSKGNSGVLTRGICWSFDTIPTVSDFKTIDGSGVGAYESKMTDLMPNTDYYVRAYFILDNDTVYGNQLEFRTLRRPFYIPGPMIEYSFNYSGDGVIKPGVWQLVASKIIEGEHISSLVTEDDMSIVGATLNDGVINLSSGLFSFNGVDSIRLCYRLLDSDKMVDIAVGTPKGSDQKSITLDKFILSNDKVYDMLDQDKTVSIYVLTNQNPVNFFKTDAVFTFTSKSTLAILWR